MQTFLPFEDFQRTAEVLDYRRLGKQRVEAKQILNILTGAVTSKGWTNHPATLAWIGHANGLKHYFNVISTEWVRRGYKHNMGFFDDADEHDMPDWLGMPEFHRAHQSNLIRKNPEFYVPLFPGVPDNLEYIWPSKITMLHK